MTNSVEFSSLDEGGDGVRVVFSWQGDRYRHEVFAVRGDTSELCFRSVEGDAAAIWPLSPALQQLHDQTDSGGKRMLFLTGMAGNSHWSMSVQAVERGVEFDVAARVKAMPEFLGSTYDDTSHQHLRLTGAWNRTGAAHQMYVTLAETHFPCTYRWKYAIVQN